MRQRPFVAIGIHNGFAVSTIRTTCMLLRSVQFESDRSPDRSKL
jgi:hypothetical protein